MPIVICQLFLKKIIKKLKRHISSTHHQILTFFHDFINTCFKFAESFQNTMKTWHLNPKYITLKLYPPYNHNTIIKPKKIHNSPILPNSILYSNFHNFPQYLLELSFTFSSNQDLINVVDALQLTSPWEKALHKAGSIGHLQREEEHGRGKSWRWSHRKSSGVLLWTRCCQNAREGLWLFWF